MTTRGRGASRRRRRPAAWTRDEVQRDPEPAQAPGALQLTRRRRPRPEDRRGLTDAFDSEAWQSMGPPPRSHEKLKAAEKHRRPRRHARSLRRAVQGRRARRHVRRRLLRGQPAGEETRQVAKAVMRRARSRAATSEDNDPRRRDARQGRPPAVARRPPGSFFVKENAFSYGPPAGDLALDPRDRPRDLQRRRRRRRCGRRRVPRGHGASATPPGTPATAATAPARTSTATSSSSASTTAAGKLVQTLDDYVALETVLRPGRQGPVEGLPGPGRGQALQVDLSNAGNLRLVGNAATTTSSAPASSTGRSSSRARGRHRPGRALGEDASTARSATG